MTRLRFLAIAAVAASTLGVAAACSLGLDETLLDRPDATPEVETGAPDTGADVVPPTPDGGTCARDEDCATTHGCLRGRCDLGRGACAYDVCKTPACNSAACNTSTQQCGAPKPYRYRAGTFAVGAPVSCFRCVAAVHPWLVVLTASGPLAFNVSDPQAMTGTPVPITGLGFYPNFLVQSGSRVFFFGPNQGPNPTRLPIAWIDMPADPFATTLVAKSVLATLNRPPEGVTPASREGDSILYLGPAGASYPAAVLQPPLNEPLSVNATPLTFTAGTTPVGVSGSRLVMRQINNGTPIYGFIPAGSASPGAQQDVTLTDAGLVGGGEAFAQLPSGTLFWVVNGITAPPVPGPSNARALRGYFLVANGTSGFDPPVRLSQPAPRSPRRTLSSIPSSRS
jgi:hypothetical protein